MQSFDQDITAEGWFVRAESKEAVARRLVDDRKHCREAWHAAGTAVEFALKGVIMRRRRLNRWPSRDESPDLYHHDLRRLMEQAGLSKSDVPRLLFGKMKTVLDWDRLHDYAAGTMERRTARTMVEAAFGPDGVIEWLRSV